MHITMQQSLQHNQEKLRKVNRAFACHIADKLEHVNEDMLCAMLDDIEDQKELIDAINHAKKIEPDATRPYHALKQELKSEGLL